MSYIQTFWYPYQIASEFLPNGTSRHYLICLFFCKENYFKFKMDNFFFEKQEETQSTNENYFDEISPLSLAVY